MSSRIFRLPFRTSALGLTGSSPTSCRMCWSIISLVIMVTAARVMPRIAEMSTREIGPCSRTTFRICMRFRRFRSSLLMPQSFMLLLPLSNSETVFLMNGFVWFRRDFLRIFRKISGSFDAVPRFALCGIAKGNTAQRASGDFARHLLANFPSYFTKMLVNTSSIHSAFCFI